MELARGQLARLVAGKAVANSSHRWIAFFLPTLATAFSASTSRLTTILGIGEMAGLSTLFLGRQLDRGHEQRIMAAALGTVAVSAAIALVGSLGFFLVSYVMMLVGVAIYTVGGHTFISRRVPYKRRARSIGIFEVSWAMALLIGAPIAALLINLFGWRGPYVAIIGAAAVMAILISNAADTSVPLIDATGPDLRERLSVDVWIVIAASASIAMAGLALVVIAGTWLDEALGVSTGGVGLVAMAFGVAELAASTSSAAIADRVGPNRATRIALGMVLVGILVMHLTDDSLLIGSSGLIIFFLGFEFAIVTSFSIVSEAMPTARGRALAVNNGVGTFSRGAGIVLSGLLYVSYGIKGPTTLSAAGGLLAISLLTISERRSASGKHE